MFSFLWGFVLFLAFKSIHIFSTISLSIFTLHWISFFRNLIYPKFHLIGIHGGIHSLHDMTKRKGRELNADFHLSPLFPVLDLKQSENHSTDSDSYVSHLVCVFRWARVLLYWALGTICSYLSVQIRQLCKVDMFKFCLFKESYSPYNCRMSLDKLHGDSRFKSHFNYHSWNKASKHTLTHPSPWPWDSSNIIQRNAHKCRINLK